MVLGGKLISCDNITAFSKWWLQMTPIGLIKRTFVGSVIRNMSFALMRIADVFWISGFIYRNVISVKLTFIGDTVWVCVCVNCCCIQFRCASNYYPFICVDTLSTHLLDLCHAFTYDSSIPADIVIGYWYRNARQHHKLEWTSIFFVSWSIYF